MVPDILKLHATFTGLTVNEVNRLPTEDLAELVSALRLSKDAENMDRYSLANLLIDHGKRKKKRIGAALQKRT